MPTTRVKICGITRPQDVDAAARAGADYVGINLFEGPRRIGPDAARQIIVALPKGPAPVALIGQFSENDPAVHLRRDLRIRIFQVYQPQSMTQTPGDGELWIVWHISSPESLKSPDFLRGSLEKLPVIPAKILFDAHSPGRSGGTGLAFDWHWIEEAREAGELANLPPIILAGGLTPDNVAEAIRIVRPYAVDVSSGVEIPGKPGIKDPIKVRDFIQAAKGA